MSYQPKAFPGNQTPATTNSDKSSTAAMRRYLYTHVGELLNTLVDENLAWLVLVAKSISNTGTVTATATRFCKSTALHSITGARRKFKWLLGR